MCEAHAFASMLVHQPEIDWDAFQWWVQRWVRGYQRFGPGGTEVAGQMGRGASPQSDQRSYAQPVRSSDMVAAGCQLAGSPRHQAKPEEKMDTQMVPVVSGKWFSKAKKRRIRKWRFEHGSLGDW